MACKPSSLRPGESAPTALNIEPPNGDTAKAKLAAGGIRGLVPDTRAEMAKGNVRPHPHMRDANAGGAPAGMVGK